MSGNKITTVIQYTLESRGVAQMVGKNHKELLRDIRGYIENMESGTERKIAPSDFFIESNYKDGSGKTNPCYDVTRKGCEFISNKLTGQKGTLFTGTYINKFHEMEEGTSIPKLDDKTNKLKIQEMNAKVRMSNMFLKLSNVDTLSAQYKSILVNKATEVLLGQQLLPMAESEQKTYSATELGNMFGLSSQKIGRLTNDNSLKTEEYGEWYRDKSRYSSKEVDSFRYFDTIIPKLEEITGIKAGVAV